MKGVLTKAINNQFNNLSGCHDIKNKPKPRKLKNTGASVSLKKV
jgi:hypothetical protein